MNNKKKNNKVFYDYRIRTEGGFGDAVFLISIVLTFGLWFMIFVFMRG